MLQMEHVERNLIQNYGRVKEMAYDIAGRDLEKFGTCVAALEAERFQGEEIVLFFQKHGKLSAIEFTKYGDVSVVMEKDVEKETTFAKLCEMVDRLERMRPDLDLI